MKGFYLIDKPNGITSFDVIRKLKKILQIKRIGHTGTLDPLATGGLLIAVGNYTKLIPFFEKDTKEYEFTLSFDGTTPSFDKETEITYISDSEKEEYKKSLTQEVLQKIIAENFTGEITQVPPKYSALKIGGKKALDKVRSGEEFEMKARKATISQIEILNYSYPELTLRATVTAGTYIRSIASDMGEIVGSGAYITMLRRTKIGKLDLTQAQILDEFNPEEILSEELLFGTDRFIELDADNKERLDHGLPRRLKLDLPLHKEFYILNSDRNISNVVKYDGEYLNPIKKI